MSTQAPAWEGRTLLGPAGEIEAVDLVEETGWAERAPVHVGGLKSRVTRSVAVVIAAVGVVGCEKPGQMPDQGDAVARKWIAAAVNKDGQTYCGLMTPKLLQSITGQAGATAKMTCEKQIKGGTGDYPFQFAIPKAEVSGAANAQVDASGKKLRGHITLTQQKGKLLIDAVR